MQLTVTPRQIATAIGALLAAAGIVVLLWPVSTSLSVGPFGDSETVSCGSALVSNDPYGASGGSACSDALVTHRAWGWPLLGVGVAVAAAALFVTVAPRERRDS